MNDDQTPATLALDYAQRMVARRGRPLNLVEANAFAVKAMQILNNHDCPCFVAANDSVHTAGIRFLAGRSVTQAQQDRWLSLTSADQLLQLHHERAVLAWLSIKAKGLLLDQWLADALRSLAKNWWGVSI